MKKTKLLVLLIFFVGLAGSIVGSIALSQGETFYLDWWSADSSGATLTTGNGFQLSGSAGQHEASSLLVNAEGSYRLGGGFLYGAVAESVALFPILLVAESGYSNIQLTWNATNDPDIVQYRISRVISRTVELTPIAVTTQLLYFDEDPALFSNVTYCYQIEALDTSETIILTSNLSCALFGQLGLWVPEVWAQAGTTTVIPVNIHNAYNLGVSLAEIWLEYDPTVIEPISVASTALTIGYEWDYLIIPNGPFSQMRMFTNGGAVPPVMYGEGGLLWVTVSVLGPENSTTYLNLLEFIEGIGGTVIYTPDNLINSVPLTLEDGQLHAELSGPYRLGDLNGNSVVQAVDALIALDIANGVVVPSPQQLSAGDVNGDGQVGAADASMILYYSVYGYWPPLNQVLLSGKNNVVTISLEDIVGEPGDTVDSHLKVTALSDWAGGEFVVVYPRSLVAGIADVRVVPEVTGDFNLRWWDEGNGLLHIALANDEPFTGEGNIVTISLNLSSYIPNNNTGILALAQAKLNDRNGRDFATILQTTLERENGVITLERVDRSLYLPTLVK